MKLKKTTVTLLVILSNVCSGNASAWAPEFVNPSSSTLRLSSEDGLRGFLYFSGDIEIQVTYQFKYHADAYRPFLELTIHPIENSLESLPYLTERKRNERPNSILVNDIESAAAILLNGRLAREVLDGKHLSVVGEAKVIITEFAAGYECDQPLFLARIIEAVEHIQFAKTGGAIEKSNC